MCLPDVFILGDSHTTAIIEAMRERGQQPSLAGKPALISRFARNGGGKIIEGVTEEEAVRLLAEAGGKALLFSTLGGNQFNVFGMMQHPVPWDFIEPDVPEAPLDRRAMLIPVAVLEQQFQKFVRGGRDGSQLLRMKAACSGRVIHLLPPPPKEDGEFVKRTAETHFRERDIAQYGVSPAPLRLKLWHLQARLTRLFAAENGIEVMTVPVAATTHEGYLAREYYGRDATHANAAYGELVLRSAEEIVQAALEVAR